MANVVKTDKLNALLQRMQDVEEGNSLVSYLKAYLAKGVYVEAGGYYVEDKEKKPDLCFHPSSDCLKCPRLLFFEKIGDDRLEKPEWSVEQQVTFRIGHALHCMVQSWLVDMGRWPGFPKIVGEPEVPVDEARIRGHVDVVMDFPDGVRRAIEIKSINARQFRQLREPLVKHKLQLEIYLYLLGLSEGIILYLEKDYPHEMAEFHVSAREPVDVFTRWARVMDAIEADDISVLEHGCQVGDRTHQKCPARAFCWEVG